MSGHDDELPGPPAERGANPPTGGDGGSRPRPIRPELQNWRVIEVDGANAAQTESRPARAEPADATIEVEAVIVEEAAVVEAAAASEHAEVVDGAAVVEEAIASVGAGGDAPGSAGEGGPTVARTPRTDAGGVDEDQVDSILIAGLPERTLTVEPGSSATLVVSLLNNGAQPAVFDIHLEGWVRESWLPPGGVHVPVLPGERIAATLTITPPRHPTTTAGEFPFYVLIRSPQHLRRSTRLRATLIIRPFTEFSLGRMQPASVTLHAFRRRALFTVPVANLGNHPLALQLKGQGVGLNCAFDFNDDPAQPWQPGPAVLELAPGSGLELFVRAAVRSGPLFASRPIPAAVRVVGSVLDELRPPRSATAEIFYSTPIRPWHLVVAVLGSLLLLAATGLMALAARMLLETGQGATAASGATGLPPAPVVIVLNQAPPAPAPVAASDAPGAEAANPNPMTVDGLPVVQADQVTAPGEPARPRAASAAVSPSGNAPARTYAQMFQEIALQYDLDWRLLAAQAYEESGFDPVALGNDGDMGLMQVLPATWREWAPQVGATDPFDAYSNTLVAAAYLNHVRGLMGQRGKPQAQWMLVAYNWGPDKLGDFVDAGGAWDEIPPERLRYATEILSIARTIP